ncbi:MAG TPA: GyrI-like domain-containing protein [Clostridiaceae bacterium]|jgi:effector-binding domain-containing protein|nr:GyrI-like domain-containing protein [Clostridiaceae bacterium]
MDYQITLKQQAAQPVLSIRKITSISKLPEEIGKAYGMIAMYMQEMGEQPKEAPFTAYYNMDMENLDVEMGFPVSRPIEGRGDIKAGELPEGKYVEGMYKGPYSEMSPAYDAISAWMKEKGLTPTGIAYEYYFNTPGEVPDSELLTKIVFPVK